MIDLVDARMTAATQELASRLPDRFAAWRFVDAVDGVRGSSDPGPRRLRGSHVVPSGRAAGAIRRDDEHPRRALAHQVGCSVSCRHRDRGVASTVPDRRRPRTSSAGRRRRGPRIWTGCSTSTWRRPACDRTTACRSTRLALPDGEVVAASAVHVRALDLRRARLRPDGPAHRAADVRLLGSPAVPSEAVLELDDAGRIVGTRGLAARLRRGRRRHFRRAARAARATRRWARGAARCAAAR